LLPIRRMPLTSSFPSTTLFRSFERAINARASLASDEIPLVAAALRGQPIAIAGADLAACGIPAEAFGDVPPAHGLLVPLVAPPIDRKSTRLNSSHEWISYAVFC